MLIVEQPPAHCLLTDKKAVEIRRLRFGTVPLGVCAIIMVAKDRKHTVRGLYLTENPHGLEQLGCRGIYYVARKQHQIGLLRIHNRHRFGKGAAVFRPAPGMYIRNLHQPVSVERVGKGIEIQNDVIDLKMPDALRSPVHRSPQQEQAGKTGHGPGNGRAFSEKPEPPQDKQDKHEHQFRDSHAQQHYGSRHKIRKSQNRQA